MNQNLPQFLVKCISRIFYTFVLTCCFFQNTKAQVGIGTQSPNSSSILDVTSTTKGFLPPRLTRVQRNSIANPAEGLVLFCSNCCIGKGVLSFYNGTQWMEISNCSILDTDHDGIADADDVDSDNDGILNTIECPIVNIPEYQPQTETYTAAATVSINSTGGTNSSNGLKIDVGSDASLQITKDNNAQTYDSYSTLPVLSIGVDSSFTGSTNVQDYATSDLKKIQMTDVMGTGTSQDPYYVKVEQYADFSGVGYDAAVDYKFTVIYTYIYPEEFMKIEYIIDAPATNTDTVKLYHFIDTYLQGGDQGPAYAIDSASNTLQVDIALNPILIGVYRDPDFLGFIEFENEFTNFYSGNYFDSYHDPAKVGGNLSNHVDTVSSTDNEVGIQYTLGVPVGEIRRANYLGFDQPSALDISLSATKTCNDFDFDSDGIPNYLDLDSDNDGIPDNVEAQDTYSIIPSGIDSDNDGLDNAYEANGVTPHNTSPTNDEPDYLNLDSDGDATTDQDDAGIILSGEDLDKDGLDNASDATTDYTDPNGILF